MWNACRAVKKFPHGPCPARIASANSGPMLNSSDETHVATEAKLLTREHLEHFKEALLRAAPFGAKAFQPPTSSSDRARMLAEDGIDFELAPELETWWNWFDGLKPSHDDPYRNSAGSMFLIPFYASCTHFRNSVREAGHAESGSVPAGSWLNDGHTYWMPIAVDSEGYISGDCRPGLKGSSKVFFPSESEHHSANPPEVASSLGEVVEIWTEALERGAWAFDTNRGKWTHNHEAWPDLPESKTRFVFPNKSV